MHLQPFPRFLLKTLLLSLPFLLLLGYYVVRDPFMVLRSYPDYDHSAVCQNEGFVSWQKYKLQRTRGHYDAFLMGNSCTMAFACGEWNRHIHAHPFRLFCNNLGLADLCQTLEALDRQPHQPVRHLLVVADRDFFSRDHISTGAMHIMPPEVSHRSWTKVQTDFLQAFFDTKVLLPYLSYAITGRAGRRSQGVINTICPVRTTMTNDAILAQEDSIARRGEAYWEGRQWDHARLARPTVGARVIFRPQQRLLEEIRAFCQSHHTDLRLVIGPNTDRIAMHPQDIARLKSTLAPGQVYDYSSRQDLCDRHNFYDGCHYRRNIGTHILQDIYGPATPSSSRHQSVR
ncbi:MAG: hypothetical protein I3J02_03705 [Prevotella sp.]|nr:hypothetical protein [Prevotella sp.]